MLPGGSSAMGDLLFVGLAAGAFALLALYTLACGRA
jgi:hypothetical protein